MTKTIAVSIERTPKKVFASAADWPGWSRSGKTEDLALEALAAYAPRYAGILDGVDPRFRSSVGVEDLDVVERNEGSAGTDYGVPSHPSNLDGRPTDVETARRLAAIVEAAWAFFDRTAAAAPEELRKGPRGGGRTTSRILAHVMDSDRAYAAVIGIKVGEFEPDDREAAAAMRGEMLEALRAARDGTPLAGRRWPARYAAHRIAWHALDHAWEIEDRSAPDQ